MSPIFQGRIQKFSMGVQILLKKKSGRQASTHIQAPCLCQSKGCMPGVPLKSAPVFFNISYPACYFWWLFMKKNFCLTFSLTQRMTPLITNSSRLESAYDVLPRTSIASNGPSTEQPPSWPINEFIASLLKLLVCTNERLGAQIRDSVKEMIGSELDPALYHHLFDQIKICVDRFFDNNGQVSFIRVVTTGWILPIGHSVLLPWIQTSLS